MTTRLTNKKKIINDPVYGFITIQYEILFDIIEHPYFQRLRRIKQLGLTYLVYPGAFHTRFQHAIGAMHLMGLAIDVIRQKGHEITEKEAEAACIAILLHDIGHGPFSHALERSIIPGYSHEELSVMIMEALNKEFDAALDLAIRIFKGTYHKTFLHQLISSQLDMDRLDYLRRDSFFSGVSEGIVGSDRIIKMLDVVDDSLVVESKGIYSIEKFLIARRLMYWQVYLHKTVLASELMLEKVLKRARELILKGVNIDASPALKFMMSQKKFENNKKMLDSFLVLDDYDVLSALKLWIACPDPVLSMLSEALINRHIYKIKIESEPFNDLQVQQIEEKIKSKYGIGDDLLEYYLIKSTISKNTYLADGDKINILHNEHILDITEASDMLNMDVLGKTVIKYVMCYPKKIDFELKRTK